MNFKEIFIKTCYDHDEIRNALDKGYISIDDLLAEGNRFAEDIVFYLAKKCQNIPEKILKLVCLDDLLDIYKETKNQQVKEAILYVDKEKVYDYCDSWRMSKLETVKEYDILESFAEKLVAYPKLPENSLREKCPNLWEIIKSKRKEIRKSQPRTEKPEPRYNHKLEEAIMKNNPEVYEPATAKVRHDNLDDKEFQRLLPYWLEACPELKFRILETKQFSTLPYETQLAVIKDCEEVIDRANLRYIPKEALKEVSPETAYAILLEDIHEIEKQVIYPHLTFDELTTLFAPLCIAYPDKVPIAIKVYQAVILMRQIKNNEPIEDAIVVDEEQEFFIKNTIHIFFALEHDYEYLTLKERVEKLIEILHISNPEIVEEVKDEIEYHHSIRAKLSLK